MAPPSDHPDHWQRSYHSTTIQPSRTQGRRLISSETERYSTRSRNRARSNDGSGGESYMTQGSSPPPEAAAQSQILQADYVLAPSTYTPQTALAGQNIFQEPFEIQVRGQSGVTGQMREDLALGRLFGVLTIVPTEITAHSQLNGANRAQQPAEQIVAAVAPVPSLDDASDTSPPPPFVAGTLTFTGLQVHQPGRWRISVSLLRIHNALEPLGAPPEGVMSLGSYETEEILVYPV